MIALHLLALVFGFVLFGAIFSRPKKSPRAEFLKQLFVLDRQWTAAGVPPLSAFWRTTLQRFFESSKPLVRLLLRVGRRGGKSLTLSKVLVAWAVAGPWVVPLGDTPVIALVSVDRGEAQARLRTIADLLTALNVRFVRRADEIELVDRRVVFRVLTASISGVVGITSIAIACDEVARWKDVETNANPAREVVASLTPTMASQPHAFMILSSSPWALADFHAEAFALGDTDFQQVAHAETWIANPTISKEQTHGLEPDERIHRREYAAIPGDATTQICTKDELDACIDRGVRMREPIKGAVYCVTFDAAFRKDNFAAMVSHLEICEIEKGRFAECIVVDALEVLKPTLLRKVSPDTGATMIAKLSKRYNDARAFGDIYAYDALEPLLRERGVTVRELKNTPQLITARVSAFRRRITMQTFRLLDIPDFHKEILDAQLQLLPGGRVVLRAPERKGKHDDQLSAALLALDVDTVARLPIVDGEIVIQEAPFFFDREQHVIVGGERTYWRKDKNGDLMPAEPPYGSAEFVENVKRLDALGITTPSIIRWKKEQKEAEERMRGGMNAPVQNNF